MSECRWSEQMALCAGRDLAPHEEVEARRHASECEACAELLRELEGDSILLQSAPALSETSVASVRSAVINRIPRRSRPAWFVASGIAAAVAVLLMLTWPRPQITAPKPTPSAAVRPPAPKQRPTVVASTERPARHVVRPKLHTRHVRREPASAEQLASALLHAMDNPSTATAESEAPLVITAQTADPDVVIVLIADSQGAGNE